MKGARRQSKEGLGKPVAATGLVAPGPAPPGDAIPTMSAPVQPKRATHYLWAVLIARICEVLPLLCPVSGGQMRLIASITHSADIRQILDHIGVGSEPPNIAPARAALNMPAPNPQACESAADFMRRVKALDLAHCPRCTAGRLRVIRSVPTPARLPAPGASVSVGRCRGPP